MGELIWNYCKVVHTLSNKTVVACVHITDNILRSEVFISGYSSNDYWKIVSYNIHNHNSNLLSEYLLNAVALLMIRVEGLLQCTR